MIPGGQCVMTCGTALMLLWSASNWNMHTLEVSILIYFSKVFNYCSCVTVGTDTNITNVFATRLILGFLLGQDYLES